MTTPTLQQDHSKSPSGEILKAADPDPVISPYVILEYLDPGIKFDKNLHEKRYIVRLVTKENVDFNFNQKIRFVGYFLTFNDSGSGFGANLSIKSWIRIHVKLRVYHSPLF